MIKFGLTHSIHNAKEVCLKPSDVSISEMILTWKTFESVPSDQEIQQFVEEMTPVIFSEFQKMEIDEDKKANFYL